MVTDNMWLFIAMSRYIPYFRPGYRTIRIESQLQKPSKRVAHLKQKGAHAGQLSKYKPRVTG